jgi:hypothetical protein
LAGKNFLSYFYIFGYFFIKGKIKVMNGEGQLKKIISGESADKRLGGPHWNKYDARSCI